MSFGLGPHALAELRVLLTTPGAEPGVVGRRLDALAADAERHFAYEERYLLPALDPERVMTP